jgi:hypothetical protein
MFAFSFSVYVLDVILLVACLSNDNGKLDMLFDLIESSLAT